MSEKTFKPLDELIVSSGLKLDYISSQMGISRQRLYDIRINPATMGINQMEQLANILDVDFLRIYDLYKKFKQEVSKNATKV